MLWNWNLHWEYTLTNEVDWCHHQLDHVTLTPNGLWYVYYISSTWKNDDIICCLLLSRAICGPAFNFIIYSNVETPGGPTPLFYGFQPSNFRSIFGNTNHKILKTAFFLPTSSNYLPRQLSSINMYITHLNS